jgi:hypothetical protein
VSLVSTNSGIIHTYTDREEGYGGHDSVHDPKDPICSAPIGVLRSDTSYDSTKDEAKRISGTKYCKDIICNAVSTHGS